jgi:N6-L-threonylcarbamoyladenine synthase
MINNNKNFSSGMKLLAIETSCDETAIAIIEAKITVGKTKFKILGNDLSSQIAIHTQYGGVFPMMAKREHGKNIIGILEKVLKESKLHKLRKKEYKLTTQEKNKIQKILARENDLAENFIEFISKIEKPKIDAIAVTTGPGLEPALWVGISFAKALGNYWGIPIVPVNHMEGHIFSIFPQKSKTFTIDSDKKIFPLLSLLVSGGHTELVLVKDWQKYKKIGQTRDDAVGEAFDKVARMLELPYPGGPEISKLASIERSNSSMTVLKEVPKDGPFPVISLPRPMMYTKDFDFSFSGLKTAVLYLIRDFKEKDPNIISNINFKQKVAMEFQNAAIETLVYKTIKAIKEYKIKTLIVGGGVSADKYLQEKMDEGVKNINSINKNFKIKTHFPIRSLTGDNALMIAIAGYYQYKNKKIAKNLNSIKAQGNMSL